MERITIADLELAYELDGSGEPVVLVHWGVSSRWGEPLAGEPALADRFRVLRYHRAGFGESGPSAAVSIADHAEHCRLLLRRLGIERAHVVGHSSSALVALQLALDSPDTVQTLALMDAARPAPDTEVQAAFLADVVQPAVWLHREGRTADAVDVWARGVFGPGYAAPLEAALPGVLEQLVAEADTFFGQELPALQRWVFTEAEARRVTQPVLAVLGARSAPTFTERRELLLSWLPNVEPFDLPDATHLLHLENPTGMADALASFFARHPLEVYAA
jgi:pimeloyl-ACP methyl ester carboxylesterase